MIFLRLGATLKYLTFQTRLRYGRGRFVASDVLTQVDANRSDRDEIFLASTSRIVIEIDELTH